eukprot:4552893-Pleurochrysis_carterae.AAC.1
MGTEVLSLRTKRLARLVSVAVVFRPDVARLDTRSSLLGMALGSNSARSHLILKSAISDVINNMYARAILFSRTNSMNIIYAT